MNDVKEASQIRPCFCEATSTKRKLQQLESAFTLIELLVVIAIIAILGSVLLPALGKAKEQGRKSMCLNHFRQLHVAWQMYTMDNDEHFPYNDAAVGAGEFLGMENWVSGFLSPRDGVRDNTNSVKLLKAFGGIGSFVNEAKIFKCPADQSFAKINGSVFPRVRSVAMNNFMGAQVGTAPEFWSNTHYLTTASLITRPPIETGFVLIDTHEDSIGSGFFSVGDPQRSDGWEHFPANRHNGGATISFSDGHVVCHKWADPRTKQPVTRNPDYLYGVLQPGNPDVRWLHARATVVKTVTAAR